MAAVLPTARTAVLAAAAAPLALVVAAAAPGAWVVAPAAGAALILLVIVDALMAGRLADWQLSAPADCEVGEPALFGVSADFARGTPGMADAALALDPRLHPGGKLAIPLVRDAGRWHGSARPTPVRRGAGAIERIWLRWTGPLGLGARQAVLPVDRAVRVRPDLAPLRSPALQHILRDAQFGLIARRIRGDGTQFEALREYEPGMDRRRIDWKTSGRHRRLFARENEAERNNQIVFALDSGLAMCEPVDGLARIDRAVSAALTAAWVALKGGDRVMLFSFARRPEMTSGFVSDTRGFQRLQAAAAEIDYRAEEPNFTLALATLSQNLKRRSLIVLFSDFNDPAGAEMMIESLGRLVERHLVLFVTFEDTELLTLQGAEPGSLDTLATAVAADTLARQRALVLERLRRMGIDAIQAPWQSLGYRVIDRYLENKRVGAIG
ncbi:DUF58 domain-containing protein [Altererythrobacter aerius]|uniref:DUF58 domain-containing protein n=1 Tax=Tsuneonella aeria TaxID=1837929 RepID=A0A6I4TFW2_9SPHN|nr:DUF58 domain-containing protein [Tsuneonella aeria]MXO74980.1 DUF58 domain-containing protein [Tsuneonella aeria]